MRLRLNIMLMKEDEMPISAFIQSHKPNPVILLFISALVVFCSCNVQRAEIVNPTPVTSATPQSPEQQKAIRMTELFDRSDCRNFFLEFPATFVGFSALYGFDDEKGEAPLYGKSEAHVSFFFDCPEVSKKERIKKTIGIGLEGKWDADAVGLFQDLATELIFANPDDFKSELESLNESQASSFWYFILDGPEPHDPEVLKNYDRLRYLFADRPKIVKLIKKERERIVAQGH